MAIDHELRVHRNWIGLLQPVGLVVSPPALHAAQAYPDRNIFKEQQALLAVIRPPTSKEAGKKSEDRPLLPLGFEALATQVLGWKPSKLAGSPNGPALPELPQVVLPEFGETLRPTFAVPALKEDGGDWMMLVQELADGVVFDELPAEDSRKWHASPQVRLERLLRETDVPIGILANGGFIRLVYAPRGESSGHITWPVHRLVTAIDRDMLSALCMLLGSSRLFTLPRAQRLPHILKESRKYQDVVSTKLAGQVLEALNDLLRGFQAANEAAKGRLLRATVRDDPDHVYGGLLAVLLRLVFVLYAEERGLLSTSAMYVRNYSLVGLFEKLRIDAGRFPDTMDQRYGAWSRLLVLFRMVHDGAKRGDFRLPPRYGHLFDPDGWGFLEGRSLHVNRVRGDRVEVPKVADGVVLRVLEKLLLLDGERLSYRALDVEQIGSVYENMMGFELESALETSIGVGKQHVVVGLETLLKKKGAEREKFLKELASVEVSGKAAEALRKARNVDDLVAALSRRISSLTPRPVPAGGLYLQPTDERRRSGSHYTPRELTEPIVRTTLRPIFEDLGERPKPEKILQLKVCDPAMGSGAFLVETCRQLADRLVKAYEHHGRPVDVSPDEDILLYAQRQVAQHCLYGVDKNPFAVDLGKLSLWLATLARDHAFTFLDHSIRHGDSLVGLTREQIEGFHWAPTEQLPTIRRYIEAALTQAIERRAEIAGLADSDDVGKKRRLLDDAEAALTKLRTIADAVVASFFNSEKAKDREQARDRLVAKIQAWLDGCGSGAEIERLSAGLREDEKPVPCFHWEIEFPEVFARSAKGFDAVVGNPPFAGKNTFGASVRESYPDWLKTIHAVSHGNADLVAHFFRRAFALLRPRGAQGLIATNTIAQGDTRSTGLRWLCLNGGTIYTARRRVKWPLPGAAVIVSVVHVKKGEYLGSCSLDGREVPLITAFLFHRGAHNDPLSLPENAGRSFQGSIVLGMGFTFDDTNEEATPIAEMERLISKNPRNQERIFPYIGGEEVNTSPTHAHHRFVINFGELSEQEARKGWPDLITIVERKVKPARDRLTKNAIGRKRAEQWWLFGSGAKELQAAIAGLERVIVVPFVGKWLVPVFVPASTVVAGPANVIALDSLQALAVLQSRPHEIWARFFGSSLKDDSRYTPSDCFETFPFPLDWIEHPALEAAGREYYDYRAALMRDEYNEGLTKIYNRFHDPEESDPRMMKLRELHAAMDRAVLDAYGWSDIQPSCEFLLDYEEDGDEPEAGGGRRKKKPWRYRWPDDVRDEVLARLLELNAQRAKEQSVASQAGDAPSSKRRGGKKRDAGSAAQTELFGKERE